MLRLVGSVELFSARTHRLQPTSTGSLMRPDEIKDAVERLPLSEKLLLVADIWDSIAEANAAVPMPCWQREELDRRYREYREGRQSLHDWKAVHEELRAKTT